MSAYAVTVNLTAGIDDPNRDALRVEQVIRGIIERELFKEMYPFGRTRVCGETCVGFDLAVDVRKCDE